MKQIIFAFLVSFVICSCGNKDKKTEISSKMDEMKKIDTSSIKEDIKTKEIKPPVNLPSDMPMYSDAKILSSIQGGTGPMVTYETEGKPEEIGEFYKSEMKKNGYKANSYNDKMMKKDGGILTYTKEGKEYNISYRFNESRGKTVVTIQTSDTNK